MPAAARIKRLARAAPISGIAGVEIDPGQR
jgi:hypothetical protein